MFTLKNLARKGLINYVSLTRGTFVFSNGIVITKQHGIISTATA